MKHCPDAECLVNTRTGVPAEFLDEIDRCPHCGRGLAPGPAPTTGDTPVEDPDDAPRWQLADGESVVTAGSHPSHAMAELIAEQLMALGIPSVVADRRPASVLMPPVHSGFAIDVRERDFEIAREFIARFEAETAAQLDPEGSDEDEYEDPLDSLDPEYARDKGPLAVGFAAALLLVEKVIATLRDVLFSRFARSERKRKAEDRGTVRDE